MSLPVRFPKIDYSSIPAQWAPKNRAFAYDRNAQSFIPTPMEPWLIRIFQKAVDRLGPKDDMIREQVHGFIGQESQHFRQHRQFNKALIDQGYPELAKIEQQLADELAEFEKTKSLKFILAYADGFESFGAIYAKLWFEKSEQFFEGADPNALALWGWHLAEEFEHREVAFNFYKALFCRGPIKAIVNGYFYRLYGLFFAAKHLNGFVAAARSHMLKIDRARMTEEDRAKLREEARIYNEFVKKEMFPELLKTLLPWYNPKRKKTPPGMMQYLSQFDPGGVYGRQPSAAATG